MTGISTKVITRWARAEDAALPFIAEGIPASVVLARIDRGCVALAEIGSRPVGALQLEYLWGTRPYIAMIRVLADWQRRGIGRALLAFVEGALAQSGHHELLSSAQANEMGPQAWHHRMGFTRCGMLAGINEGDVDEVFFRKTLAPAGAAADHPAIVLVPSKADQAGT